MHRNCLVAWAKRFLNPNVLVHWVLIAHIVKSWLYREQYRSLRVGADELRARGCSSRPLVHLHYCTDAAARLGLDYCAVRYCTVRILPLSNGLSQYEHAQKDWVLENFGCRDQKASKVKFSKFDYWVFLTGYCTARTSSQNLLVDISDA